MIIEKLKGHSGCKLSLHKKRGLSFIRKKSPTFEYNLRLKKQCEKQLNWNKEISFVPRVLDTGYHEGLFYFDMEYILGSTISSLISEDQMDIEEVIQYIISYFKYQNHIKKKSKTIANKYLTKMRDLNNLKIRFSFMKNLNEALFLLNDNCWFPEYKTVVHGDLTLENLIKSKLDGKIYMIDFLDDFSDSIYTDISKIFQDILGGWSFIDKENNFHINSNSNISVRMLNMRKKIIKEIKLIDKNKRAWQDILYILLMNYLRIIPYIKNDNLYTFIDNKLKETINLINEEKDNLKNIIKR